MKPEPMNWQRFFKSFTPEERQKLEADIVFKEAYYADDFDKAQARAAELLKGKIVSRKKAAKRRWIQRQIKKIRQDMDSN